nr:THUMP domain-containing protein 1 homolog [Megalopta genalis]
MDVQRKKKNYYQSNSNNKKRRKQSSLEPGLVGFLCTCNFREKDCIRDAYELLNEFADEIYGSDIPKASNNDNTKTTVAKDDSVSDTEQDDDEDISAFLNKEINRLKSVHKRFQVVDTGVKNVIFIRSTLANPLEIVTKIVTELDETKQQRTRYILRLLPIEIVCKAYMNDIKQKADTVLEKYFAQEPKTFSIVFNHHSNHSIHREEVIKDLAEIISKKNPGNKADLKNPELAVIVEVIRGVCLISIAPHYYKFKKYNLVEICNVKEPGNSTKKIKTNESTESNDKEKKSEDSEASKDIVIDNTK